MRTDGEPFRVELRWPVRLRGLAARLLAPQPSDFEAVSLPAALWPGYSVVRLLRLTVRRVRRTSEPADLGPFLGTPESLVEPLLRFAGVRGDDLVLDLGCGDGRILVRAAQAFGCRARGVETDGTLVERARLAVDAAGLAERVEIVRGDAARAGLEDASVVIGFLPVATVDKLLPSILGRLRPGARLVTHEQERLRVQGERRLPLVSTGGISVAHRWDR